GGAGAVGRPRPDESARRDLRVHGPPILAARDPDLLSGAVGDDLRYARLALRVPSRLRPLPHAGVGAVGRRGVQPGDADRRARRRGDQGLAPAGHGLARREHTLHRPRRLMLSITFHFVAWVLGTLEAYLILRFLGIEASLPVALVIEAFGTGVRFVTFVIPGSLGVLEGSYVATFVALGLSPAAGVSF